MSEQKKNGNKLTSEKIALVTATLGLVKVILEVIKILLE